MAITNRTLGQAMGRSDLTATLDSATGTLTGYILLIGTEYMLQTGPAVGTVVPVRRGQLGSAQQTHAVSAAVEVGLPSDFTTSPIQAGVFTDGVTITGDGTSADPLVSITGAVTVSAAGALSGNGSGGSPLAVRTDNVTIQVNGSNNLEVIGGSGDVTASGTLAANAIVLGDGTTVVKTTTTGTGIVTALGVNVGSAGAPVIFNGALGTPSSGTGTNLTGIPEAGLSLTDITTNNSSTSKHGFAPKLDNNAAHFLNGQGGWTTPSGSGAPSILAAYSTKTANYTADAATDGILELTTNAATFTLPTAASIGGQGFIFKNLQTANALTINTTGGQTVDGAASGVVTIVNGALMLISNGANWRICSDVGLPLSALTSGGVLYASSTTAVASSALLAAHAPVVGGGAGTAPNTIASAGTAGQLLVSGGASADPAFATNAIIVPVTFNMGAAIAGSASLGVSTPASGGATAGVAATTVPPIGIASFDGAASNEVHCQFMLPSDWTASSTFDVTLLWRAAATTGNVVWQVASLFVGDGVVLNTAYNTASTVTDAAKGTTLQLNSASITGITASGTTTPAASKAAFFKILRDGGQGSDTMSGVAQLLSATFYYRRTPVLGA